MNYDLKEDCESAEIGLLKIGYTYCQPSTEYDHLEALHMTIHEYFNLKEHPDIILRRINNPGILQIDCANSLVVGTCISKN